MLLIIVYDKLATSCILVYYVEIKKSRKSILFKRKVVETFRTEIAAADQILHTLHISQTELRHLNRFAAIKIATLNGATALGMNQSIGTIETEKAVDLLVIDSDPSKNINDIRKV